MLHEGEAQFCQCDITLIKIMNIELIFAFLFVLIQYIQYHLSTDSNNHLFHHAFLNEEEVSDNNIERKWFVNKRNIDKQQNSHYQMFAIQLIVHKCRSSNPKAAKPVPYSMCLGWMQSILFLCVGWVILLCILSNEASIHNTTKSY